MLLSTAFFLLYWLSPAFSAPAPAPTGLTEQDWVPKTQAAVDTLQQWYNTDTGLWETAGWWRSANILTTLGNFALLNPSFKPTFEQIAQNTYAKAPVSKPKLLKIRTATSVDTYTSSNIPRGLHLPRDDNIGFLNNYYDDEGWWALAWLKAYDVTQNNDYLNQAITIFSDMTQGYDATCGGIWWSKARDANVAIANELFLAVAAALANRVPAGPQRDPYATWVSKHWTWFRTAGFINADNLINDGLNLTTCTNNNATVWSYNQGVILGALAEADATGLFPATDPGSPRSVLPTLATAAIAHMQDANGVIHEACEPACEGDGSQFKGIFVRNLQASGAFSPAGSGGLALFEEVVQRNARSIWGADRNIEDNRLGVVWSGPYGEATASTQSSALDVLVAAVEGEVHAA